MRQRHCFFSCLPPSGGAKKLPDTLLTKLSLVITRLLSVISLIYPGVSPAYLLRLRGVSFAPFPAYRIVHKLPQISADLFRAILIQDNRYEITTVPAIPAQTGPIRNVFVEIGYAYFFSAAILTLLPRTKSFVNVLLSVKSLFPQSNTRATSLCFA